MKTKLSENSLFGDSGRGEVRGATAGLPPTKASKQKAKQQTIGKHNIIESNMT